MLRWNFQALFLAAVESNCLCVMLWLCHTFNISSKLYFMIRRRILVLLSEIQMYTSSFTPHQESITNLSHTRINRLGFYWFCFCWLLAFFGWWFWFFFFCFCVKCWFWWSSRNIGRRKIEKCIHEYMKQILFSIYLLL